MLQLSLEQINRVINPFLTPLPLCYGYRTRGLGGFVSLQENNQGFRRVGSEWQSSVTCSHSTAEECQEDVLVFWRDGC